MQAESLAVVLQVRAGGVVLLLGRRLFWLFVAVVGFLASFDLAPRFLPASPPWLVFVVAVAAGAVGALLAMGLQYVAAGIVGFVGGVYGSVPVALSVGGCDAGWIPFVGGVVGAVLMVLLFDWALIVLSALVGARAVLLPFALDGADWLAWLALAAVGIAVQASMLARVPPGRRTEDGS